MFSYSKISKAFGLKLEFPQEDISAISVSIDTRTLLPGEMFVALSGAREDGHSYLKQAFEKGASGALIDEAYFNAHSNLFFSQKDLFKNLILSPNPQKSLVSMAAWYRMNFSVHTAGITGSVGKTSTKEFLSYLLSKDHQVLATRGNLNNHLGLPLTLFLLDEEDEFCVAELGASFEGEIEMLAHILKPDLGIITMVSPAHLEGFGSIDAIYETKLGLFRALAKGAPAIFNDRDIRIASEVLKLGLTAVRVGETPQADFRIEEKSTDGKNVYFKLNGKKFSFPSPAPFLAINAAMAIAAAVHMGIPFFKIPEDWSDLILPSGRFERRDLAGDLSVIYDGYNASPGSFQKALEAFRELETPGRKILVFADMLELGEHSQHYHAELGHKIVEMDFDQVFSYGKESKASMSAIEENKRRSKKLIFKHFSEPEELISFLVPELRPGDLILFKASRGMKIDKVLERIAHRWKERLGIKV